MEESINYLEAAYFISGIVVAICAIIALYQIRLAKASLQIQSKRDSLKLTAAQCSDYSERIIKLQNNLFEKREKDKCSFLMEKIGIFLCKIKKS